MTPFISLVIVSLDGRRHLERLLPSIRSQEDADCPVEIIVVNNASRDGTTGWLARRHPDVRVLRNVRNEGFAAPCNRGAREARGTWIGFLNNDVVLEPGWLRAMTARARSEAASVYAGKILDAGGRRVQFGGAGMNFYGAAHETGAGLPVEACPEGPGDLLFACGASMLVRRDVFLDAGGFDPDFFAYFEDVDFGWRLRLFGHRILYAPEAVCRHVHQGTSSRFSSAKTFFHCERNLLYGLVKNLSDENLHPILCASLLFTNRRALMGFPFPAPDLSFADEAVAPRPRPVRTPRALLRKAMGLLRRPFSNPYVESMSRHMVLDHVLSGAEGLWEKRRQVQSRRKVPDREIFPLFGDPLFTPWKDPGYVRIQEALFRTWGIDRLFAPERPARILP